ncbi:helix-turn-helix domain-containing protein [Hyalangium versicolor]|uniref:helix-turn-helix domain-containing protein n=1 Tax=Hyalangium versicolor TaxID=2861190 RepID=UPI001CCD8E81|nr:AraC family transcriptional regulator [Hyalangium versicolor]
MEPRINATLAHVLLAALARRVPPGWWSVERGALAGQLSTHTTQTPVGPLDEVLTRYHAEAGSEAVFRLGVESIRGVFTPALALFREAPAPRDAFERWHAIQQLGRHPQLSLFEPQSDELVRVRRVAHNGAPREHSRELAMCGLISALLEDMGCRNVSVGLVLPQGVTTLQARGAINAEAAARITNANSWLIRWDRHVSSPAQVDAPPPAFAWKPLVGRVWTQLGEAPTLPALARVLGRSPRTLQRRLAEAGLSLDALRGARRVQEACRLISEGQPLATCAMQAGFSDVSHMGREFRRLIGLTPGQFRAVTVR